MSNYNPTTEEIRFTYATNGAVLKDRAWDESVEDATRRLSSQFDRWLAAHDAVVRAGGVAKEPEWEYGNEQLMHSRTEIFPASSEAVAKAQSWLYPVHRRRKAGPWEPLEN